ncbi:type I restriction modification DNA specificity domain protein [Treponema lecithinolyticum ATCC 700332]|uniref:Type I restriction modification DNA specificity domain protein n=1 Tax=Treponema lecithinolyticum ATCC 700332 TaxID=1321815 RepID=A0ABN0NYY1_TRELE|nr:type I restriction modification DNA specificity domain protein [Treponema lecithinolyticum ATCC 700332]
MYNRHYEKFADGRVKDIEDAIPFALPESWAWCRLGEIYYHTTGKALKKSNEKGSLKKYITTSNLYWDTFDFSKVRYMYFTDEELDKCTIKKGDLVVCNGGDVGRAAIWNYDHDICYQNHVSRMRPKINGVENRFFLYVLMFYKEQNLLSGKGIGISSLSASDLLSAIVPLPPTNQQRLIVSEMQKIFYQINLLAQNKADLQAAVKQAKSKILDLAIRGKLVPQDPDDEPASVMLEKLRAEKEAKIAAGEIKRGKNDSYIYKNSTDNCYYEKFDDGTEKSVEILSAIPESWTWCHFGDISDVINGKNQSQVEDDTGEYPIYGSGGIMGYANDYICPENCTIIGRKGSINNPTFMEEKFWNVDTAFGLAPSSIILPRYLFYFCKSFDFTSLDSSTTLPSLTKANIQHILFPLPPFAAQQRILDKIDELFSQLDKIFLNIV